MATGSDAENDDTGTSLKASAGHVTIFRPAKGKPTSKSTNKSASAAKKTAKLASKGKKSTADLAQAISSGSAKPAAADPACPKALTASVAGNADVMLNQTNIGETTSFTECSCCKKATLITGCGQDGITGCGQVGGVLVTRAKLNY